MMTRFALAWLALLLLVTALLTAPGNWFPDQVAQAKVPGGIGLGKLLHVSFYAFLAGSAGWLPLKLERRTAIALALIAHGGLTEVIQLWVPYREGSTVDWAIDSTGVLLGWLVSRPFWGGDAATGP